jgi:hypothetical protein
MPVISLVSRSSSAAATVKSGALPSGPVLPSALAALGGAIIPLYAGPKASSAPSAASHENTCIVEKRDPAARQCINCLVAKKGKMAHSATDTPCLFGNNRFDRGWLKRQFLRITK